MGLYIDSNGKEKYVEPSNGKRFSLEEMQKYVGGFVAIVRLPKGKKMVVDEDGLMKQSLINGKASKLTGQVIVGNVLICEKTEMG